MKKKKLENAEQTFEGNGVKITEDGRRHLGGVLGSHQKNPSKSMKK